MMCTMYSQIHKIFLCQRSLADLCMCQTQMSQILRAVDSALSSQITGFVEIHSFQVLLIDMKTESPSETECKHGSKVLQQTSNDEKQ